MTKLVSDTIDRDDINDLISWLSQEEIPRLTKGELTIELEKKWAEKIGTKHSIFVNSGSSAILLTLASLKVSNRLKNNKIIVPSLSWVTDVSSPMLLGFDVTLCDSNLNDLSVDLVQLEYLFQFKEPSVFILVTPLGLVPNMEEIVQLCEKYDVLLLEDNCESMGSKYKGKYLGNFGLASFYSTYFGHHISTIEGGFINTNDDDLYYSMLMMRSHGWDRDLPNDVRDELRIKHGVDDFYSLYNFYLPGMNLRSTDLQAKLGLNAIKKLDTFSEKRNNNFKLYKKYLMNNELNLTLNEDDFISNFAYPVINKNREKIINELIENNIEVRPLISGNMARKPFWKKTINPNLKNCDYIHEYGFYLPNHQDLTEDEIIKISEIVNKY